MVELNIIIFISIVSLILLLLIKWVRAETLSPVFVERRNGERRMYERRSSERRDDLHQFHLFDRRCDEPIMERRMYDRRTAERRGMKRPLFIF